MELIKIETNNNVQLVSAKEMYLNLGMDRKNWASWSKTNITNNDFFNENVDFWTYLVTTNGNQTTDYKITIEMAKLNEGIFVNSINRRCNEEKILFNNEMRGIFFDVYHTLENVGNETYKNVFFVQRLLNEMMADAYEDFITNLKFCKNIYYAESDQQVYELIRELAVFNNIEDKSEYKEIL